VVTFLDNGHLKTYLFSYSPTLFSQLTSTLNVKAELSSGIVKLYLRIDLQTSKLLQNIKRGFIGVQERNSTFTDGQFNLYQNI